MAFDAEQRQLGHSDTPLFINVTSRFLVLRSRKQSPGAGCTISINTFSFRTNVWTIKRLMNCRRDRVRNVDKTPSLCIAILFQVHQLNRYERIGYCTFGWFATIASFHGSLLSFLWKDCCREIQSELRWKRCSLYLTRHFNGNGYICDRFSRRNLRAEGLAME